MARKPSIGWIQLTILVVLLFLSGACSSFGSNESKSKADQEKVCRSKFADRGSKEPEPINLKVPPIGWNPYNYLGTVTSEDDIIAGTKAMVANGMQAAGYHFINLDDGWQGPRDKAGELSGGFRFGCGIKELADFVHSHGFNFGIYTSPSPIACSGFPGSGKHVEQDVATFAKWGVDFIKLDWCGANYDPDAALAITEEWKSAISKYQRPMVLSINAGGHPLVLSKVTSVANTWRVEGDICSSWYFDTTRRGCGDKQNNLGIRRYIDLDWEQIRKWSSPGHFPDPDMLEVGNDGVTLEEARSHFSLWALWSAPLIAGNNPQKMNGEDIASQVLLNQQIISIDQDPLGKVAVLDYNQKGVQIWKKQLESGFALAIVNLSDEEITTSFTWVDLKIPTPVEAKEIWTGQVFHNEKTPTLIFPPHSTRIFRVPS